MVQAIQIEHFLLIDGNYDGVFSFSDPDDRIYDQNAETEVSTSQTQDYFQSRYAKLLPNEITVNSNAENHSVAKGFLAPQVAVSSQVKPQTRVPLGWGVAAVLALGGAWFFTREKQKPDVDVVREVPFFEIYASAEPGTEADEAEAPAEVEGVGDDEPAPEAAEEPSGEELFQQAKDAPVSSPFEKSRLYLKAARRFKEEGNELFSVQSYLEAAKWGQIAEDSHFALRMVTQAVDFVLSHFERLNANRRELSGNDLAVADEFARLAQDFNGLAFLLELISLAIETLRVGRHRSSLERQLIGLRSRYMHVPRDAVIHAIHLLEGAAERASLPTVKSHYYEAAGDLGAKHGGVERAVKNYRRAGRTDKMAKVLFEEAKRRLDLAREGAARSPVADGIVDEFKRAAKYSKRALDLMSFEDDQEGYLEVLRFKAEAYKEYAHMKGDAAGHPNTRTLLEISLEAYTELARLLTQVWREQPYLHSEKSDEALEALDAAIELSLNIEMEWSILTMPSQSRQVWSDIGNLYQQKADLLAEISDVSAGFPWGAYSVMDVLDALQKAVEAYEQGTDGLRAAQVSEEIADLASYTGNYALAEEYYQKALDYYESVGDLAEQVRVNQKMIESPWVVGARTYSDMLPN